MPLESVTNFMLDDSERNSLLPQTKPTIRILLYTDDPLGIRQGDGLTGLSRMQKHLHAHAPAFATLEVEFLSRNADASNHAGHKLTDELLARFDQIWFFGVHQVNRDKFNLGVIRGGPQSELEPAEVEALTRWMRVNQETGLGGGGVLMTGDHANERPKDARPSDAFGDGPDSQDPHLGLGRAIGRRVPRAGQLRKWEGDPTARSDKSFNTQAVVPGVDIDNLLLQLDKRPQQLILQSFDIEGRPTAGESYAHPLFFYKGGALIQVFPDHAHEGAVVLPEEGTFADKVTWPESAADRPVQPRPHVAARGVDKRNSKLLDLVAAYNGDCAGAGRIVATSSWHHFLNVNLLNFQMGSPPGSAGDQIGQFYGNLALWLSPRAKRLAMTQKMTEWLGTHLMLLEELGGSEVEIGRRAYSILTSVASPCEVHELLQGTLEERYRARFETAYFPEAGFTISPFPSKEVLLGSVIAKFHEDMSRAETAAEGELLQPADVGGAPPESGFERARRKQAEKVEEAQAMARKIFG